MRKLLPYEHQLIQALGVTKEEYLNFVAIQQDYKDPKVGTALDVRNADGGATVALVLTIVGTLFQVGAALLAPKPEIPDTGSRRRNRQQRFAPSFGFNSAQDLAKYGDPVNLIYTNNNDNKLGSVRASGSLVWSQIENFGSSQFMQLMVVIGASKLKEIDFNSIAFGQKDLSVFDRGSFYIFSRDNGKPGIPLFKNLVAGHKKDTFFPTRLSPDPDGDAPGNRPACLIAFHGDAREGFSQAYTPSASTSLGVFDVVPINVNVLTRDEDGDPESANNLIKLGTFGEDGTWRNDTRARNGIFEVGNQIELKFAKSGERKGDKVPGATATDMRRQMVESLDFSSTYLLGSARFRLQTYNNNNNTNLEEGEVRAVFQCIERGAAPSSDYDTQEPKTQNDELKREIENAILILENTPKSKQRDTGTVDANDNTIFETVQLIPTIDPETGEPYPLSDEGNLTDSFAVTNDSEPDVNITFNTTQKVTWIPKLFLKDDEEKPLGLETNDQGEITATNGTEFLLPEKEGFVERAGSIAYSEELKLEVQEDVVIDVDKVRRDLRQRKKALKSLIDDIHEGVYNGEGLVDGFSSYGPPWSAHSGRDPNENSVDAYVMERRRVDLENDQFQSRNNGPNFIGYDKLITRNDISVKVHYTFVYVDRHGTFNYFNFGGIEDTTKEKYFPKDEKLAGDGSEERKGKRQKLKNAKQKLSNLQAERDNFSKSSNKIKKKIGEEFLLPDNPDGNRNLLTEDTILSINDYDGQITEKEENIENLREGIQRRIDRNFGIMHKLAVTIIKDDINYIETIVEQLPSTDQKDRAGTKALRMAMKQIIKEKQTRLGEFKLLMKDWDKYTQSFDNSFFAKCLVKSEKASYETLSEIDTINFSLKAKLFRRISGRQKKYGEEDAPDGYSSSDNGVKSRMVFFRMFYKKQGGDRKPVAIMFAIRRGSESDFYTQIRFKGSNGTEQQPRSKWAFDFEPVHDVSAENELRPFSEYAFLEQNGEQTQVFDVDGPNGQIKVSWTGRTVPAMASEFFGYFPDEDERGPVDTNEWDMFSVNSDTNIQFSHEGGPEIILTAVSEQQFARNDSIFDKYGNLTMMAVGVYANRGLQDLRSVSALVKKGKDCRVIDTEDKSMSKSANSSSYAPDIFVDTLLDPDNGVGKYISQSNIDVESLALAKDFCKNNNLPRQDSGAGAVTMFMDGIIADAGSWREFWINVAPFSLLELARKNGKDTLVPALPVNSDGKASLDDGTPVEVNVSALFTAGNILEGSYKEEFLNYGANTEDLIASVVYREFQETEVFNKNRTVDVRLAGVGDEAIRETFDLSQFVTQREQAIMFAKLLCNQRSQVKKGIEFRTLPSEAGLEPGGFIYVDVGMKTWDKYSSGILMENGELNSPLNDHQDIGTDTFEFLLYKPLTGEVESKSSVSVTTSADKTSTASSLSDYKGWMFVMGSEKPNKRVFRVTELEIEGDGELSVKAIEYPCFESGGKIRAKIADFSSSKFEVS